MPLAANIAGQLILQKLTNGLAQLVHKMFRETLYSGVLM